MTLFGIKQPITFSVLPLQRYSKWTAEEAHRRGYDVILHIPMEAISKMKLGKGGLYLAMSNSEIIETLEECVTAGLNEASVNEIVLLSPACASFDMFKSYADRGEVFKDAVKNLVKI